MTVTSRNTNSVSSRCYKTVHIMGPEINPEDRLLYALLFMVDQLCG